MLHQIPRLSSAARSCSIAALMPRTTRAWSHLDWGRRSIRPWPSDRSNIDQESANDDYQGHRREAVVLQTGNSEPTYVREEK